MTNTPCQWLACQALEQADQIVSANRVLIEENLARLDEFVQHHANLLKLIRPDAGTMALVEQRTELSSTEFCEKLLIEQRALLDSRCPTGTSRSVFCALASG